MDAGALAFLEVILGTFVLLLGLLFVLRLINWLVELLGEINYGGRGFKLSLLLLLVVLLLVAAAAVALLIAGRL